VAGEMIRTRESLVGVLDQGIDRAWPTWTQAVDLGDDFYISTTSLSFAVTAQTYMRVTSP